MKLCKEAMGNATACGKNCCCLECDRRESCSEVCGELSEKCEFAFESDTSLVEMQKNAAVIISGIAALAVQKKQIEEQGGTLAERVRMYERSVIENMMLVYGSDVAAKKKIAKELGISLATLYNKLAE